MRALPERVGEVGRVALLVAIVGIVHGAAVTRDFVSFDDNVYVYENQHVQGGLSAKGVAWAFQSDHGNTYFHPITWLSLMLDREVLGAAPWGFHLVNVLLHAVVVVLLYSLLRLATARPWPSLIAAAIFAAHPVTLESVSWVTERKTVLSAAFGFGAVLLYVAARGRPSSKQKVALAALFVAAMAAKASWVVLPGLLLVMDAWPLSRLEGDGLAGRLRSLKGLTIEKLPMLALSVGMTALVLFSARGITANIAASAPLGVRIQNAIASLPAYLGDLFWPFGHAVFHPFPASVPMAKVAAGVAALLLVTAAAFLLARRHPSVLAGCAWFGVALLPHLGLWQSGLWPSRADRFVYVAFAGVVFGLVFLAAELIPAEGRLRGAAVGASCLLVAGLGAASVLQGRHWNDSLSLYRRAVEVEPGSGEMRFNLGDTLMRAGRFAEARAEIEAAIRLQPWNARARVALAGFLQHDGDALGAEQQYREAIRQDGTNFEAMFLLAESLRARGRLLEAREMYQAFLGVVPADQQRAREYVRALLE